MSRHWMRKLVLLGLMIAASSSGFAGEATPFIAGSWASIRSAHTGKATIVQFWGLTCAPCRAEMPEWGKLAAESLPARLVLVHAERAPAKLAMIAEFLKTSGLADVESWYFAERFLERLRYEIDPAWHGETPMTLLIARNGSVRTMIGSANLGEIRRWALEEAGK